MEMVCDLAIAIMQDNHWDPAALHAPNQHLMPSKQLLEDDIPFAEGRSLIVDVPVDPRGIAEVYIDDTLGLTVDIAGTNNDSRLEKSILLAIHVAARPKHPSEPIPREEMAALAKLIAESRCEEIKIYLGWELDFRRLLVSLPENKFVAWHTALEDIINRGTTTEDELEKNIGRLIHLGMILPRIHHFLSRLRELQWRAKNRRLVKVSDNCLEDLRLMLFFLDEAKAGISFNLIAYRKPTYVFRSDSCPAGLGGYSHFATEGLSDDYFLESFTRPQRIKLIGAFAMAMRGARFSGPAFDTLAEGTIRGAISFVAQTFRDCDQLNPTRDEDGELGRLLSCLFRAFRNADPNPKQQKALPMIVLKEMAKMIATESQRAKAQLAIGAIFFACRSCKYLTKVPQSEKRRTDVLRLRCLSPYTLQLD